MLERLLFMVAFGNCRRPAAQCLSHQNGNEFSRVCHIGGKTGDRILFRPVSRAMVLKSTDVSYSLNFFIMITISLRSVAEAFVGFAWWASFSVLALMVVLSVIAVVCGHYDDKGYWPKKALKITVLGKNRQWFRVTLLITNIACCVWLLGCHDYSPWILAVPLVSYPLSGIVVTWVTRLLAVFSWLLAKSIEYYLKIFRLNWF